jgi:hypothetical protein
MKSKVTILLFAAVVALSSTSASAHGYYRYHHYRWHAGYSYRFSSLPGGGMLDRGAALNH